MRLQEQEVALSCASSDPPFPQAEAGALKTKATIKYYFMSSLHNYSTVKEGNASAIPSHVLGILHWVKEAAYNQPTF